MLFFKRSKSFSLGVISIIVLMVAILILTGGCGDGRNPVEVESQRIEQLTKPIPFMKGPLEGVLPSVPETPTVPSVENH